MKDIEGGYLRQKVHRLQNNKHPSPVRMVRGNGGRLATVFSRNCGEGGRNSHVWGGEGDINQK